MSNSPGVYFRWVQWKVINPFRIIRRFEANGIVNLINSGQHRHPKFLYFLSFLLTNLVNLCFQTAEKRLSSW